MNLIEQIASHLEFVGIGVLNTDETAGDITWGIMPDQPDTCVCVYSTDSSYPGSDSGARIQIVTRSRYTSKAYLLSQRIVDELAGFSGFLSGDGPFAIIELMNGSQGLGADSKTRELYSSNFTIKYCDY